MSHTPGPWRFDGRNTITTPSGEKLTAVGLALQMGGDDLESKANARLIAAAPDLLEALEWYVANDDTMEMSDNAVWLAGRDKAIAAIKKAKGGAE